MFKTPSIKSSKAILALMAFLLITACAPRKSINPQSFLARMPMAKGLHLSARLEIKRSGYGFTGDMELFKKDNCCRVDILSLPWDWPLVTAIEKAGSLMVLFYQEQRLFTDSQAQKVLKSWFPSRLSLCDLSEVLSGQVWFLKRPDKVKRYKNGYLLSAFKRSITEYIWLNDQLRPTKICLKNAMGDVLWQVDYKYVNGQLKETHLEDMMGVIIKVQIEQLTSNPEFPQGIFSLPNSGHIR